MSITVELRRVPEGEREPRAVAQLRVLEDGGYELTDPEGYVDPELLQAPLIAPGGRRVTLQDDPQTWARNLGRLLRTGYLVPVVVQDDREGGERG